MRASCVCVCVGVCTFNVGARRIDVCLFAPSSGAARLPERGAGSSVRGGVRGCVPTGVQPRAAQPMMGVIYTATGSHRNYMHGGVILYYLYTNVTISIIRLYGGGRSLPLVLCCYMGKSCSTRNKIELTRAISSFKGLVPPFNDPALLLLGCWRLLLASLRGGWLTSPRLSLLASRPPAGSLAPSLLLGLIITPP